MKNTISEILTLDLRLAIQVQLPHTSAAAKTQFKRELGCQVIQTLHLYRKDKKLPAYDSVRAPFPEDKPLYEGAGFRKRNHIQIAVINTDCIKGDFHPIKSV